MIITYGGADMKEKKRYRVQGNAKSFGNIVKRNIDEETYAVSEAKARNNIAYRVKRELGLTGDSNLKIDGTVTEL